MESSTYYTVRFEMTLPADSPEEALASIASRVNDPYWQGVLTWTVKNCSSGWEEQITVKQAQRAVDPELVA